MTANYLTQPTTYTIMPKEYTIEKKNQYGETFYAVYEFGTYPRSSVLAGQTRKSFVGGFDTEAEAIAAYSTASIGYRDACNTVSHLPDEPDLYM